MDTFRAYHEELKLIDFIDLIELEGGKITRWKPEPALIPKDVKIGSKIHIKSIQGIYEVIKFSEVGMTITCGTWRKKYESKQQKFQNKHVFFSDFQCLAKSYGQSK